ncbi:hypothetical protein L6164_028697 [Bauhinia variegata]|uniref:Uncharacterized protein n=1 Tax=Bauhinia variegata TaxID=167791 RepID=A0ACB9L7C5_BAUVA|nr:hypothetical protein L6164_028697 [Bauhinia variegata]
MPNLPSLGGSPPCTNTMVTMTYSPSAEGAMYWPHHGHGYGYGLGSSYGTAASAPTVDVGVNGAAGLSAFTKMKKKDNEWTNGKVGSGKWIFWDCKEIRDDNDIFGYDRENHFLLTGRAVIDCHGKWEMHQYSLPVGDDILYLFWPHF